MSREIPRSGAIGVALSLAITIIVFIVLNSAFGGPGALGGPSYRVSAYVGDAQNLVGKSLVLVRGVRVGDVAGVQLAGGRAVVTIAVDPSETTVYRNATIEVGHRSLFGEAYVRLDPGTAAAGRLPSGSTLPTAAVKPTVELDAALQALDKPTRAHLSSLLHTTAAVQEQPATARELNDTLAGLAGTLSGLRQVSADLYGQRADLTGLVTDWTAVVQELGAREQAITNLVSAGRGRRVGHRRRRRLRSGLAQASLLLASARSTLTALAPLARRALPVVGRC